MKTKRRIFIRWAALFFVLLILILCTSWRWVPVVRAYAQYRQIKHELWLTESNNTMYAGLGNEIPYPTSEYTKYYPIADLNEKETEDILAILSEMENPHLIHRPTDNHTVEMIIFEHTHTESGDSSILTFLTQGQCDDAIRFFSNYFMVGRSIYVTCDNYTAVHDKLLAYLCSLDQERYGCSPVIVW